MCAEEMEGAKEDTAMHRKMTQREMPPEKAEREELTLREMPQDKTERQETAQREMPLEKTAQKEMPSEKVEREELTQKEMPPKTAMCRRNMGANTFWDFFDLEDEAQTERDFRMLQSMYPKEAKELLAGVEEICDQMEYSGSSMYDEYPDYTTIYTLQKKIADMTGKADEDLIRVLLLQEMHRRRSRHRSFLESEKKACSKCSQIVY